MNKLLLSTLLFFTTLVLVAQVGIGTANPDASAVLEIKSTTKGFLPPRIADETLIATPAKGLVIYNTTESCLQVNIGTATVPDWQCMGAAAVEGTVASLDNCATPTTFGTVTENADATGVSFTVNYSGGNGEAFTGETVAATGVAGTLEATLTDGTFASGAGSVTYNLTGTATASGTASFAISVGGQSCTVSVTVTVPKPKDTTTTIVEVAGQNGTVWMDRNLGATQQATSSTDAAAYGHSYQWGRVADGHQIRNSATASGPVASGSEGANFIITTSDWLSTQDDTLWQAGYNDPCPTGYRIPTETELNNERKAFATNNAAGAAGSALKLPAAGFRSNVFDRVLFVGSVGSYWSSTVSGSEARYLYFSSDDAYINDNNRSFGYSVRCIKDVPPPAGTVASLDNCDTPITSGTVTENADATGVSFTINYSGGNGDAFTGETVAATGVAGNLEATLAYGTFATGAGSVTYNLTGTPTASGTASFAITVGGQTCTVSVAVAVAPPPKDTTTTIVDVPGQNNTVWMDRNLGATKQATSSTDAAAYGDLYQWGRAADGHQIRTSTTAAGPVASGSEGANFIIDSTDWLSTRDDTRWQAGNNDPCPTGYRIPTETELDNEISAFATENTAGAAGSVLKLPAAGGRNYSSGSIVGVGNNGLYWTSTVRGAGAHYFYINSTGIISNTNIRSFGYSVRCIKK